MDEFAALLRQRLTHRGALARLAEDSGVAAHLISRYALEDAERRVRPAPRNLERLAPALGIAYEDLLRLCGYLPGTVAVADGDVDPDLAYVTSVWSTLPEHQRATIVDIARARAARARRAGNSVTASAGRDSVIHYDYQTRLRDRQLAARLRRVAAPSPRHSRHVA